MKIAKFNEIIDFLKGEHTTINKFSLLTDGLTNDYKKKVASLFKTT